MRLGVSNSGGRWVSDTVFEEYVVPLLQEELQVDPLGVCGVLIPLAKTQSAVSASSQRKINNIGLF
jgi:hypothetical protein